MSVGGSMWFGVPPSGEGDVTAGAWRGAAGAAGFARACTAGTATAPVPDGAAGETEVACPGDTAGAGVGSVWLVTWSKRATTRAPTSSAPIAINRMAFDYPGL